jgi:hypothetical protein
MYEIVLIVSIIKKKKVKPEKVGRILYKLCRNRMLQNDHQLTVKKLQLFQ